MKPHNQDESITSAWYPLQSSRVKTARYDKGQRQVHVIFHNHGVDTPYTYDGVGPQVFNRLLRSASPGKFVNRVLNGYPYFQGGFNYAGNEGDDDE